MLWKLDKAMPNDELIFAIDSTKDNQQDKSETSEWFHRFQQSDTLIYFDDGLKCFTWFKCLSIDLLAV